MFISLLLKGVLIFALLSTVLVYLLCAASGKAEDELLWREELQRQARRQVEGGNKNE